jgi:glycosyltransferase involved in cell wall biosynthesis
MNSRGSADRRDLVVLAYGYAASPRDAVARVVEDLATELRSRGRRVTIIGIPPTRIVAAGGNAADKIRRLRSELRFLLSSVVFVLRRHREMRAFISVDVPSGLPFVGALARRMSRGRVRDIAWVMDLYRLTIQGGGHLDTVRARLELSALRSSAKIITIGECMAAVLSDLTAKPVSVIPLWHRDMKVAVAPASNSPLRLLYSGSARDIHPLLPLVQAVGGRDDVELQISGSGSEVERVRAYLANHPQRNVQVGGFVEEQNLASAYARADVHVVSLSEVATGTRVPSKVYAAMASGRGVLYLGSTSGQAARDVLNAGAGIVVETDAMTSMSAAITQLASNRARVVAYGTQARRFFDDERALAVGGARWADELVASAAIVTQSAAAS